MSRQKVSLQMHLINGAVALLIRLVGCLPLSANRALATFLGWFLYVFPTKVRRVTRINIDLCFPDKSDAERHRLSNASVVEDARAIFDMIYVWLHPQKALTRVRDIRGADVLDRAMKSGRPVVVLAPHMGSWELMNLWLSNHYDMHILFKPSGLPALDKIILRSREAFRTTAYPITSEGLAEFNQALQEGHVITGVLPDQVARRGRGLFVDYFGRPAYTSPYACRLIQKHNAIPFVVGAKRVSGQKGLGYDLVIQPVNEAIYSEELEQSLTSMNRDMEAFIREAPEQYLWSYKRFRRRENKEDSNPYD